MPKKSYDESEMTVVGTTNAGWGVCGITSAMYAMYAMNPASRPWLVNAPRAFTVLSEIKGYLRLLQEFGGKAMINEIETFTRTFGPKFANFTVSKYVDYINRAAGNYVNASNNESSAIYKDELFSIGLHPDAVVDYLKRRCGYASAIKTIDAGGDALIGVQDKSNDNSSKLYNGLCHWVYRKGPRIYSWGDSFASLAEADKNFHGIYFIKVQ